MKSSRDFFLPNFLPKKYLSSPLGFFQIYIPPVFATIYDAMFRVIYLFIFFFHNRSKLVVSTARASHIGQCLANDRERKTIAQRTLCSFKVPFIALRRQIVSTKDDIVPGETSVNDLRPREGNEREKWREYIERERGRDATLGELTFVADVTGR